MEFSLVYNLIAVRKISIIIVIVVSRCLTRLERAYLCYTVHIVMEDTL
jgi:hypothetical protein